VQAYKIETIVEKDGFLTLRGLPFQAGDRVEVIVLPAVHSVTRQQAYPLRGTAYHYDNPTEPVAEADWEAGRGPTQ
jgi:hypothetical protein